jgi:hypothetical protein
MPRGQAVAVGGSAKQTDKTIVFLLKKVRPLHVKYYLELEKQAPPLPGHAQSHSMTKAQMAASHSQT